MTTFFVLALLILINAFYVAAEFAAVGARQSRVRRLAGEGHASARLLLPFLSDGRKLDSYIAACQIGITITSLIAGAYGQAVLAGVLKPGLEDYVGLGAHTAATTSTVLILVGLTTVQMVIGELMPKSVALQFPTPTALLTVKPMRWSLALFKYFILALNGSGVWLLKRIGLAPTGHRHVHSPDEIEMLIAESRDGGLIEADEHTRLRQALRLSTRPARHVMVPRPRVEIIDGDLPIDVIVRRIAASPYTRLPVYRGARDNLIGIVHTKDVVLKLIEHGAVDTIDSVLRPVFFVPESISAERLLPQLRRSRNRQAVVVDEYGGVEGLVTMEDVLTEILGEVSDELKSGDPKAETLPDGRVRIPGGFRLDEAEPLIGVRWSGEAETVAGRVVEVLGRLPVPGEVIDVEGVHVEIEAMHGHSITSVIATPPPKPAENDDE